MKKILLLVLLAACALVFSGENTSSVKICILGSCAGTEPQKGRHHTAWLLQTGSKLYQFDAGENCAYTAHLAGYDLSQLRAIFISDHVSGLPHLVMVRNKLASARFKRKMAVKPLPIYTPIPTLVTGLQDFLTATTCGRYDYRSGTNITGKTVRDGKFFDDQTLSVEALHNRHCGDPDKTGQWFSFSYKITVNGKKIVYSGDIRRLEEMSPFLRDCDLLLMENGHHKPWQVAEKIRQTPAWKVKRLIFLHHGRSVLNTPEETARKTEKAWGKPAEFAVDGMTLML